MIKAAWCTVFVSALAVAAASQQPPAARSVTLFEGGRLITGDGTPPIESSAFIVENGRFSRVGRRSQVALPQGADRVDLSGKTVMPALIEVHAHLGYWRGWKSSADYFTREQLIDDLQRLAYHGVAAVLSLGADRPEVAYPLRDELRARPRPDLPLYFTTGPGLSLPNGGPPSPLKEAVYAVSTEGEARARVQELAAHRVEWVKTWVDSRRGALPPPLYRAIIDEAHKHQMRVMAHSHALADFKELLRSGIDGFAHPTWRQQEVEPFDDELLALFKQHPQVFMLTTFWTPRNEIYGAKPTWIAEPILRDTFSSDDIARLENPRTPADAAERWASGPAPRGLKKLKESGIRFGLGTDMGGGGPSYFGFSSHLEIESMVKAGMTPSEAIVAATRNSAEILGRADLGTVATGKSADFLVLDANPLDDIANTRRISRVYLRGKELDRAALRDRWARSAAAATYRPAENWAQLPAGMKWGAVTAASIGADGNVYVFRRAEPPILEFTRDGRFIGSLGEKTIVAAHGLRVDPTGAIWATDVRGHVVYKFDRHGNVVLTLGMQGVSGAGPGTFNGPTDVLVAPSGDVFVADGQFNSRIAHFASDGTFIGDWGANGTAAGQFKVPHALAMDSRGRLFVADRDNGRIQIFDQRGTFLDQWTQFGPPSGIFIDRDDTLYVAAVGPNSGLLVGSARDGRVGQRIPIPADGPNGPHLVTADLDNGVYVADLLASEVRKYVRSSR